jgi:hypothetical protein
MDTGESFCPCTAQELGEYGFGLVVESVGSGHGVDCTGGHEIAKPAIAKSTGCFLDGLGGFASGLVGTRFHCSVNAVLVKGQAELDGEIAAKREVVVGFRPAKAVVQMRNVEDETEFPAAVSECAK